MNDNEIFLFNIIMKVIHIETWIIIQINMVMLGGYIICFSVLVQVGSKAAARYRLEATFNIYNFL